MGKCLIKKNVPEYWSTLCLLPCFHRNRAALYCPNTFDGVCVCVCVVALHSEVALLAIRGNALNQSDNHFFLSDFVPNGSWGWGEAAHKTRWREKKKQRRGKHFPPHPEYRNLACRQWRGIFDIASLSAGRRSRRGCAWARWDRRATASLQMQSQTDRCLQPHVRVCEITSSLHLLDRLWLDHRVNTHGRPRLLSLRGILHLHKYGRQYTSVHVRADSKPLLSD